MHACPDQTDDDQTPEHIGGAIEEPVAADEGEGGHRYQRRNYEQQVLVAIAETEETAQGVGHCVQGPRHPTRACWPARRRGPRAPAVVEVLLSVLAARWRLLPAPAYAGCCDAPALHTPVPSHRLAERSHGRRGWPAPVPVFAAPVTRVAKHRDTRNHDYG